VAAVCLLALAISPSVLFAQAPIPVPVPLGSGQPLPVLAPNQLDGLVAPIALYPDPLISQILVAATYPLELVEAYQWLQRNPGLTGPALVQAAGAQNWDPSVQGLVMFPDVLKRLNDDIAWTTNLGNAFLGQQADLMGAIQRMRLSAQQAGVLVSTPQQQVIATAYAGQPVIEIVPANPEVIYVPVYDPVWLWGPDVYYPYPRWHYPLVRSGLFFSVGISVGHFVGSGWGGWGGWGWHPAWHNRTVIVNNTFINRYNFNSRVTNRTGVAVWSHDAFHRQGVPYGAPRFNEQASRNYRQNLRPDSPPVAVQSVQPQARSFAPSRPPAPFAAPNAAAAPAFRDRPAERMHNLPMVPNRPQPAAPPVAAGPVQPQARSFAPSRPPAPFAAPNAAAAPAFRDRPAERMRNLPMAPNHPQPAAPPVATGPAVRSVMPSGRQEQPAAHGGGSNRARENGRSHNSQRNW
jgi:hypothetical protein